MDQPGFAAFLSYSHRDARCAGWLHRALETYTVPGHVVGRIAANGVIRRRIGPIFRDRDELAASADLNARIEAALAASRALIVLCSPAAARSRWTNQEIVTFKRLHPDRPILAVIVAGEPGACELPGREDEEAFPPALRYRLDASGALSDQRAEPIAADLRRGGDGRRLAKLKVIAGLLGVGLDELVQRDAARRNRRLAWITAASLAGMAGALALAVFAFEQRAEAVRQREQADGLIEFMLTDLRAKLEPVGRLDVLDSVGQRAMAYYGAQKLGSLDADALGRRARALLLVTDVAEQRGNAPRAMAGAREAARTTGELLARDPENWQRVYDHAQSVFWIGNIAGELGDTSERVRQMQLYAVLSQRLLALRPHDRRSQIEAADAQVNLGVTYRDAGRFDEAIAALDRARREFEAVSSRDREIALNLAQIRAIASGTLYQLGRDRAAIAERERQLAILAAPPFAPNDHDVERDIAYALRSEAQSYLALGDLPSAAAPLARAARIWQRLVALDPSNQEWIEGQAANDTTRALLLLVSRNAADARALAARTIATMVPLQRRQPNDAETTMRLLTAMSTQVLAGGAEAALPLRRLVAKLMVEPFANSPEHRAALAGATFAMAWERRESPAARKDWLAARDLLHETTYFSTLSQLQRAVIARALKEPSSPRTGNIDLAVAYGGYFAH